MRPSFCLFLALLIASTLALLSGCGSSSTTTNTTTTTTTTTPGTPPSSPAPGPTPTPPGQPAPPGSPAPPAGASEFLYFNAAPSGNLYGYQIDQASGKLTAISGNPFTVKANTGGSANCTVGCDRMLLADPAGGFLLYGFSDTSSTQAVVPFAVTPASGALTQTDFHQSIGVNIAMDPQGRFVYDRGFVGSQNAVAGMALNHSAGTLSDTPGSPYAFPGAVAYLPPAVSSSLVYAITFDAQPSLINGWAINQSTGGLAPVPPTQGATTGMTGQAITPSGQFLYAEQQFSDTGGVIHYEIVGYRVNADGSLTALSSAPQQTPDGGVTQLLMSPNGNFLFHVANQHIMVFAIDPASGALSSTGTWGASNLGWVAIDPAVKYVYATGSNQIFAYTVNPTTGALTSLDTIFPSTTTPEQPGTIAILHAP